MMMSAANLVTHLDPTNLQAANADTLLPARREARHLGKAQQGQAVDFVLRFGTNLQRERYLYHFAGGANHNVVAALRHYQNDDGGFGHGLEADLRSKHSSVLATNRALQILDSACAMHSPMAQQAVAYLISQYDGQNWENIGPECNDAPHAPWWRYEAQNRDYDFSPNPGAETLSYLLRHRAMKSETTDILWRAMEDIMRGDLDMHEFASYVRLYESGCLTESDRQHMLPHLLTHAFELVKVNPWDWEEYCLTPLSVIHGKDSLFIDFFGDSLEANLDFVIDQQNEDGSWSSNCAWGGEYARASQQAETELKVETTLTNLLYLQQFGRLSP